MLPPPEGVFSTYDDLMAAVQRVAKGQGYRIVKLRASNYCRGKPTRYDLVCDCGGVKYNSTAKKRNPSTRKTDCPFRAKAVRRADYGYRWHFTVQTGDHNHTPRNATHTTKQNSVLPSTGQMTYPTGGDAAASEGPLNPAKERFVRPQPLSRGVDGGVAPSETTLPTQLDLQPGIATASKGAQQPRQALMQNFNTRN
ncbi:hypothetical protein LRP88_02039 [Fusarium phalaenopsidis]